MKAAFIRETGPAEKIEYGETPTPTPKEGEALVRIKAVSVNPIDTYIRNGANYWPLPNPYILGSDFAGEVVALGPKVESVKVGDRVWGSNQGLMGRQGVFAEYAAIGEEWLYPTPEGVSDEAVAACALVGITAHLGLFQRANLKSGETLFVHGGTGGVGAMVVQMAKAAGATVIATAGSPEKAEACKKLGADHVIEYKKQDEVAEALKIAPEGVNVFWETLREPDFDKIVSMVSERGRIVLMAGRDARPVFPVGPFYVKGCSLLGFVMFKATPKEQRACADDIRRWLASGQLKPQIAKVLPLSEAAAAHKLQEENTLQMAGTIGGKIVLTV
jgi:NADPH2:quinone reductase